MSRKNVFVLAVGVAILVLMFATVASTSAATESAACGGKPTHQVRFLDFNEIPLFGSAEGAANASAVFLGEEGTVSDIVIYVPGGKRQKYLFCGSHTAGSGSVKIYFGGSALYAPEALVESIVIRNARD